MIRELKFEAMASWILTLSMVFMNSNTISNKRTHATKFILFIVVDFILKKILLIDKEKKNFLK